MSLLLALGFFVTLFFFGWEVARFALKENRIEHLIALGGIFGIGLYTFCINIAGRFLPIEEVFYIVLCSFLFLALAHFLFRRYAGRSVGPSLTWGIEAPWRTIALLFTLFVTLSVGLISLRHPMDLAAVREPTAVTMAAGNFPPVEIFNPTDPLRYHYAPDLFAAATFKVTGVPIYVAYDMQRGVFGGCLFLLAFTFILLFFPGEFFAAGAAALMMLYAGSLGFLRGLHGIPALYHKLILGQDVYAPFKFVSDAIIGAYTTPVINSLVTQHWGAMALSLMLAVVYIYFFLLQEGPHRRRAPMLVVGGLLLALLALVSEPYFAVLCTVILLFPPALFVYTRDWAVAKKTFAVSLVLLLVALPAAFFQGGLLRVAVTQELHIHSGAAADEALLYTSAQDNLKLFRLGTPGTLFDGKPLYNLDFLSECVFLILLCIPALLLIFKRHFGLALFLSGVLAICFVVPLVVDSDFEVQAGQMGRFLLPINLFAGLAIGLLFAHWYLKAHTPVLKGVVAALALVLMAQGLWTHGVWLAFGDPPGTWDPNAAFIVQSGSTEADAYRWVKTNTTADDLFLIIKDRYSDCGASGVPNCLFILNTGRMAPIFTFGGTGSDTRLDTSAPEKTALFAEVSKSCDSTIVRELGYRYVYVDGEWPKGLETKCLKNNKLNLVYQTSEEQKFIRIYKLEASD